MKDSPFFRQVQLMIRSRPQVAAEECFALEGGTAINLFWRDMPRLSVDIDLTNVPADALEPSLENIGAALDRIAGRFEQTIAGVMSRAGILAEVEARKRDRLYRYDKYLQLLD